MCVYVIPVLDLCRSKFPDNHNDKGAMMKTSYKVTVYNRLDELNWFVMEHLSCLFGDGVLRYELDYVIVEFNHDHAEDGDRILRDMESNFSDRGYKFFYTELSI